MVVSSFFSWFLWVFDVFFVSCLLLATGFEVVFVAAGFAVVLEVVALFVVFAV